MSLWPWLALLMACTHLCAYGLGRLHEQQIRRERMARWRQSVDGVAKRDRQREQQRRARDSNGSRRVRGDA